jgi:apolipoprotein D and lipocalin family protein
MHPTPSSLTALTGALLVTTLAGLAGCSASPPAAPMPTVASVDVDRYLGRWYEIASLPNRFQAMCVGDTQANYARSGDGLSVLNRCRQADGSTTEATGVAELVPGSGNAKLRVSFFRPFYGDYWVLALADDYRWVLVGEPRRAYGWLLSRTPVIAEADRAAAMAVAQRLGYRIDDFKATPQAAP